MSRLSEESIEKINRINRAAGLKDFDRTLRSHDPFIKEMEKILNNMDNVGIESFTRNEARKIARKYDNLTLKIADQIRERRRKKI